ncbi:hypothetical protein K6119_11630 [Paracrocinitomix mangrovi]|uniref:hypothetical protein n=1 Tax=Paracrocinitomix mangrovi TaxID=2862509 RepID=UPI001C8D2890|nr:hypothetical protein [Paracrocinitomix mangrovi]UKN00385.1 hypothetical protein K6119_11630 [Paracrocinitomix mangrovi]
MKKATLIFFGLFLVLTSCLKDKTQPKTSGDECFDISYHYNIRPIIETSCKTHIGPGTGCHDAWIDNYGSIKNFIVSGAWEVELFIDKTMPVMPNTWGIDSLTTAELQTMKCWLEQGYPNN